MDKEKILKYVEQNKMEKDCNKSQDEMRENEKDSRSEMQRKTTDRKKPICTTDIYVTKRRKKQLRTKSAQRHLNQKRNGTRKERKYGAKWEQSWKKRKRKSKPYCN